MSEMPVPGDGTGEARSEMTAAPWIVLDNETFDRLLGELNEPPRVIPELARLLRKHRRDIRCCHCLQPVELIGGAWYAVHKSSALGLPPERCTARDDPAAGHEPGSRSGDIARAQARIADIVPCGLDAQQYARITDVLSQVWDRGRESQLVIASLRFRPE